ncbi:MAG: aminotransferase class I/II-fold pyridoxal phosphate-dependent enzyme [Chloroflexota bacterium]|nr:aminotransferase class I/II-fold pyridoxal phosphate-dependent enzyme [Chloroflexota bacterium]MDQ5867820.1 aminotransferase class I/II-fold pyridoxal phosphate-dependent enzyme [Chloroflexota bacterium]
MSMQSHAVSFAGNLPDSLSSMNEMEQDPTPAPVNNPDGHAADEEQIARVRKLRKEAVAKYRPIFETLPEKIRVMARMVREVQMSAREEGISPEIIAQEIANRTIGDVNVRLITENIDGVDYSTIGEDLGLILPGEEIGGRISTGEVRRELALREEVIERRLLDEYNWDLRVYDVYGVGNPLLREMLAQRFEDAWGIPTTPGQTFITIGALDALYKAILTFGLHFKKKYGEACTFAFPAPGFAVVNWQVTASGVDLLKVRTTEEYSFKLTAPQLKQLLAEHPQLRLLYLTVSNNPTAFSYSPDEIADIYRVIEEDGREIAVLADLAYIGTGVDEDDWARMQALNTPFARNCTVYINSLSKVFTITGDRCGWVSVERLDWADLLKVAWNNMTAGLPASWQLHYTALVEWIGEHPEIQHKIKGLYKLRREHFRKQLQELNAKFDLFEQIGLDDDTTIYNWSKLKPGEDALTLFEKTGLAGVSGSAFGYEDQYIRFSVGFIPIA